METQGTKLQGWIKHDMTTCAPKATTDMRIIDVIGTDDSQYRIELGAVNLNWNNVRLWRAAPEFRFALSDNTQPAQRVGDVNSQEPGSGARYNDGKPAMHLIPARLIADTFPAHDPATVTMQNLARWQEGGGQQNLLNAICALGLEGWEECANVFDYGQRKYAAWNWAKGMPWSVPMACAQRHLLAMLRGDILDPESGLPHRGHVICNLVMLLTYHDTYTEGDDRPPAGTLAVKGGAK